MTPLLVLVFGVHPATAVGTDLLYAAATKTLGTLVHELSDVGSWLEAGATSSAEGDTRERSGDSDGDICIGTCWQNHAPARSRPPRSDPCH